MGASSPHTRPSPPPNSLSNTRLAEAPCFSTLLRALDLSAAPLAADAAPFFHEARRAFGLILSSPDLS